MYHFRQQYLKLSIIFLLFCGIGCTQKPSWNAESIIKVLSEKGYVLYKTPISSPLSKEFKELEKETKFSIKAKTGLNLYLYLYLFKSDLSAINAAFSINQSHRKKGNCVQSPVKGKVIAVIETEAKYAFEADTLLEILKLI